LAGRKSARQAFPSLDCDVLATVKRVVESSDEVTALTLTCVLAELQQQRLALLAAKASWTQPSDIKARYRSAGIPKTRRLVFNIKGNNCWLIVAVSNRLQIDYVKFIGTHQQYDPSDAHTIEPS